MRSVDPLPGEECERLAARVREQLETLLDQREEEFERAVGRLREDELGRLATFFATRIEEEEERSRRRTTNGDHESEMEGGDATSLKLEWERRAAEVRQRWALHTEVRIWGLEEWAGRSPSWSRSCARERCASDSPAGWTSRAACLDCLPARLRCAGGNARAARGAVACVLCAP
jgi:hypothetical protein